MDAETLRRAAEPFFSTKGLGRGTGLGLSMVHGLAAQSGGALRLDSQPGKGTRAEIWLPLADADATTGTAGVTSGTSRSDSVQISDAGRALSTGDASGASATLSSERVAELRKKVLEGAYNTTHVVSQVAQRILDRGDV